MPGFWSMDGSLMQEEAEKNEKLLKIILQGSPASSVLIRMTKGVYLEGGEYNQGAVTEIVVDDQQGRID